MTTVGRAGGTTIARAYAVGLTTATGGVFDAPDSTQASGWRTQQAFDLVRIVPPSGR